MFFRRIRGRLDQAQGKFNITADMIQDLVLDLQDGFGVTFEIDAKAAMTIAKLIMRGEAGKLPLTVKVNPKIDA